MGFAVEVVYPGVLALAGLFSIGKRAQNQSLELPFVSCFHSSVNDVLSMLHFLKIARLVPSYAFLLRNFLGRRHLDKLPEVGDAEDGIGAVESRPE